MPKAILEFDISIPEEKDAFEAACKANDMKSAMWTFDQWLRSIVKHGGDGKLDQDTVEAVREEFRHCIDEYYIKLE